MPEGSPPSGPEQARPRFTLADALTLVRLPLAVLFVVVPSTGWRLAVLLLAGATDLLDGFLARWLGGSTLGSFLDPVADKLFMAAAFGVVAFSGRLDWYEIAGVLARDAVATIAFVVTAVSGRPSAIPARLGGKAVTVCQMLTLIAFVLGSPLLRPLAWATGAIALYAIWDYSRAAAARRPL
jgi:CDP-diacylglycerol--glycerol-3-phosphate 3-phosphatidyltransferase/cardiolipin synthase